MYIQSWSGVYKLVKYWQSDYLGCNEADEVLLFDETNQFEKPEPNMKVEVACPWLKFESEKTTYMTIHLLLNQYKDLILRGLTLIIYIFTCIY